MKLKLLRINDTGKETLGLLFVDGYYESFTLEDTERKVKVPGQTRIPAGEYDITFYDSPKFGHTARKISKEYIGVPMLMNVAGFSHILIHWGNSRVDTRGCILVGAGCATASISQSRKAWSRLYDQMVFARKAGDRISIIIEDLEVE